MAIQYWQDMSILVDDIEMACHAKSFSLTNEVAQLDTTSLCSTGWTSSIGGLKSGSVNIEFMQDVATGSVDDTLYPLLGVAGTPKSICLGSADGSPAYLLKSIPLAYTPVSGAVGELAMGTLAGSSSTGPVVRGKLLHPSNVSRTSSSTGTGRQLGAVAAGQSVYAAIHVISASGTPTLDVIVQSDDNAGFTTPTTRLTFTQATGKTSQIVSAAGAITDDYWRVSYTIGGTGTPTFAFAVTVGIL
jgi:hypothetical protein